ncbi:MAG: hypothetical protein VKO44_02805 [Cyanobacteriota bacterium]|nr:hypothetical protein [Cyanobacteriota bacterium]
MNRWLFRSGALVQWLALSGGLAHALGLYVANLLAWPSNVTAREWWGSELAIRYCQGFVRRGLLGQLSWWISGGLGQPSAYMHALSLLMALAALTVGLVLGGLLVRRCGWRLGLLLLAAPVGWPVLLESAGSTFRKDPLQILFGLLLLWIWRQGVRGQAPRGAPGAWVLLAAVQVVAVFNHEPFALLILPVLALAALGPRRDWGRALLATAPGVVAFLLAAWQRGSAAQVACLRADLQRLGLLAPGEMPGSSITELALSRPSFFTWDLSSSQLGWTLVHGMAMSVVAVLAYALLMGLGSAAAAGAGRAPLGRAVRLWLFQLAVASPLLLTTVDYGRWYAMLFCAGVGLLLLGGVGPGQNGDLQGAVEGRVGFVEAPLPLIALALAGLELVLLPSGCCTYEAAHLFAAIPYVAGSQWKRLVLGSLGMG